MGRQHCEWQERTRTAKGRAVIGRMCQCSPKNPGIYALRLLLLNEKGVKSFEELQTVDGEVKTHREVAKDRGFIHTSDDVDQIIQARLLFECGTPNQCELFALVLVWHDVGDTRELWATNWPHFARRK